MFKIKSLSAFVTTALFASFSAQSAETQQQEMAEQEDTEVISVVGLRGSINRALLEKRSSKSIMDAISAEDVGKFPDANIADSLQRVTGVQISRDRGGEGRFVSIRGLSSQYNMTLLNGRTIATDNSGRDFSFDVMPSEVISTAQIYKTSQAALQEGSIGGMVNLKTAKPLDNKGLNIAGNTGMLYDNISDKWSEQLSAIASNSFMDDTLGVLAGFTYSKRDWRANTYGQLSGNSQIDVDPDGNGVFNDLGLVDDDGDPISDAVGVIPAIPTHSVQFGERERLGFVGVLQFKPSNTFETTIDTFYSKYKTPEKSYSFNVNYTTNNSFKFDGNYRFENVTLEKLDTGNERDEYLVTSFDLPNIPFEIGNDTKAREATTYMIGSNTVWKPASDMQFEFDIAYSEADRPVNGKEYFTVAGVNNANFHFEATPKVSTHTCTLEDGTPCQEVANDDIGLHFMEAKGEDVNDKALSIRADGDYFFDIGNIMAQLEFGLTYSSREKDKVNWKPLGACGYCNSFSQTLGDVGVMAQVDFPGEYPYSSFDSWPALDPNLLFEAAIRHSGPEYFEQNIASRPEARSSSNIKEDVYGGYIQLDLTGDRWDANIGGRWVQTDTTSSGHTQQLNSLVAIAGSTNFNPDFADIAPISAENSYNNFLPSVNFSYEIIDDLLFRAAASKSITRPTISQLGPDVSWEVNSLPPRVSRNGNPMLNPFEANSYDLSLEWYGEDGAGAAIAAFRKDISNLITYAEFGEDLDIPVFEPDGETPYQGEEFEFTVNGPINAREGMVQGIELSAQKIFENGFGIVANYTFVDSELEQEVDGEIILTSIDGVSENTYNLALMYEDEMFSTRLAYSFRDEFVACGSCGPFSGAPKLTKEFGSLDFSASFQITDEIAVYAEAQNLLNDDSLDYSLDKRIIYNYEQYARRYEFGARFKF